MAFFGSVTLLVMLVIGGCIILFTYEAERAAWRDRENEGSLHGTNTVVMFLSGLVNTLTMVGDLPPEMLQDDPTLIRPLLGREPALLEIVRLDSEGHIIATTHRDKPVLADLFTITQSNWFLQARDGDLYLGDLQFSLGNQPYLILAVPSPSRGVVAARMQMALLSEVAARGAVGSTGQAYIVDDTGKIVAYTDADVVHGNTTAQHHPVLAALARTTSVEWRRSYSNLAGKRVMGTARRVPGTHWVLITEVGLGEVYMASRRSLWLLGIGLVLMALAQQALIRKRLTWQVFGPITSLQQGALRFRQRDLAHRIPIARQDEIGQVAGEFNAMAGELQGLYSDLEGRVAARTAELVAANVALTVEVGERQRAEAALQQSERLYRAVAEDLPVLLCRYFPDGTLSFVNEAYCRYFGKTRQELEGHSFVPLIPEEDQPLFEAHWRSLCAENPVASIEHRVIHESGEIRWQRWIDRVVLKDGVPAEYQSIGEDITERRRADEMIRASLREKEALLKEIHHRVKNNLQIISSLLSLQSMGITDRRTVEIFRDSQARIRSMALVHEKLYQSRDLSRINFGEYLNSLAAYLLRSYRPEAGHVQVETVVEALPLGIDVAVPCGLIVNELVTNALKHAFPGDRAGRILIGFHAQDDGYCLRVADDGVGLPVGFDPRTGESLGLQLVYTLVEQVAGTVTVKNVAGTEFEIRFGVTAGAF